MARQREEQAEAARQEAAEAEVSGEARRSMRASRRARGARTHADDAQKLAIEIAHAAGRESHVLPEEEYLVVLDFLPETFEENVVITALSA